MYQAYGYDKYISRKELDGSIKYVVKSGDTLYNIAQKYNTTVSKIVTLNNLTTTMIYPNQVLFIPTEISMNMTNKITLKKYLEDMNIDTKMFDEEVLQIMVSPKLRNDYIILNSDTLDIILDKTNLTPYQLIELNKNKWLKTGERIIIK